MGIRLARRKPIYGWGINNADYQICEMIGGKKIRCPIYELWHSMIERCHSHKVQARQPTYIGCIIDERWRYFMAYREWARPRYAPGLEVDKDILSLGRAKVYSPETCLMVTPAVNKFLLDCGAKRGACPIGVNWHKRDKKFQAKITINGDRKFLGYFDTKEEAANAWRVAKYEQALILANQQNDEVRDALINYANVFYLPQQQPPQTTLPQQLYTPVPTAFESKIPDAPTAYL